MTTLRLVLFAFAACIIPLPLRAAEPPRNDRSLLDGTRLTGWVAMNGGKFTMTNGTLRIDGGMGWLRTERMFTNFVLTAEWRGLETNYNSGFFLRCGAEGTPFPTNGWQVNLKQTDLSALLKNKDILVSPQPPIVAAGSWATFQITVRGSNVSVALAGHPLYTHGLDAAYGFIGLQAEGKRMEIRRLTVTEEP